jgi:hypothetical protein
VPGIEAELRLSRRRPSLQWWRRLSAVERMLRGFKFEDANKMSAVSLGDCTRPVLQTVGTPVSPNMVTYSKGLVDTQHPAVLDDHPVVSAQSQLRTCEGP